MQIDKIRHRNGLSPPPVEGPSSMAKERKTATELEDMIEGKINRATRLRYPSRDVGSAVARVHPDNEAQDRVGVVKGLSARAAGDDLEMAEVISRWITPSK